MTLFEKIIHWLQGEMPLPSMFGWFHLMMLSIVMIVTIFIAIKFRHANDRTLRLILALGGLVCLLFETYKQLVFSFHYDPNTLTSSWSYQWYAFPFHFCSIPMYLAPIAAFLKPGKVRQAIINFLGTFGLFGGLSVMIYAEPVFITMIGINIQTMVHHGSQVVLGVFLIASGRVQLHYRSLFGASIVFIIPVVMSVLMDITFFAWKGYAAGQFNMFWISPYFDTELPLLSIIKPIVPYPVFFLIYVVGFIMIASIILTMAMFISHLFSRKQQSLVTSPAK